MVNPGQTTVKSDNGWNVVKWLGITFDHGLTIADHVKLHTDLTMVNYVL